MFVHIVVVIIEGKGRGYGSSLIQRFITGPRLSMTLVPVRTTGVAVRNLSRKYRVLLPFLHDLGLLLVQLARIQSSRGRRPPE